MCLANIRLINKINHRSTTKIPSQIRNVSNILSVRLLMKHVEQIVSRSLMGNCYPISAHLLAYGSYANVTNIFISLIYDKPSDGTMFVIMKLFVVVQACAALRAMSYKARYRNHLIPRETQDAKIISIVVIWISSTFTGRRNDTRTNGC